MKLKKEKKRRENEVTQNHRLARVVTVEKDDEGGLEVLMCMYLCQCLCVTTARAFVGVCATAEARHHRQTDSLCCQSCSVCDREVAK